MSTAIWRHVNKQIFPNILEELAAPNIKVQEVQEWVFVDIFKFEVGGTIGSVLATHVLCFVHKITELRWILIHTQFFSSHHYNHVEIGLHENNRQILCSKILLQLLSKSLQLLWLARKVIYLTHKTKFCFLHNFQWYQLNNSSNKMDQCIIIWQCPQYK